MIDVPYIPEDFGPHYPAALHAGENLYTEWPELVRCAIMVGKPSQFFSPMPNWFTLELTYRAFVLLANLDSDPATGLLTQSTAFRLLDPSEKGAVSYFLGLAFAKLFTERVFEVSELVHLAVFGNRLNPVYRPNIKSRPDLVGVNKRNDVVVVEAKGRSRAVPDDLMAKGKNQVRMLRKIGGRYPVLRLVSAIGFAKDFMQVILRDPDDIGENLIDIDISQSQLREQYYRPLRELLAHSGDVYWISARNQRFLCYRSPLLDLTIGLREDLLPHELQAHDYLRDLNRDSLDNDHLNIGLDGVICILGEIPRSSQLQPTA